MDPALAISGSKSNEATSSGASRGLLVSCTNKVSKRKNKVKAAVVETDEDLQKMVATLMKDTNGYRENVIGFEVENATTYDEFKPSTGPKTRISHLIFTNGKRAYVVFLGTGSRLPEHVLCFLLHPKFNFVSMGMQRHIDNLAYFYEAGCRIAVDLGQLASEHKDNPRLRNCGIDLLAKGVGLSETPRPFSIVCKKGFDRPDRMVDNDKMYEAVAHTYAYQQIGKTLLYGKN